MCYYNTQTIKNIQYIILEEFEKPVSGYECFNNGLQIGFDYGKNAVLKRTGNDFDIVEMEWGFIPHYLKTREEVNKMRNGYKDNAGKWKPAMITLNAVGEELLTPGKIFRDAALKRRCLVLSTGFFEWRHVHEISKKTGRPLKTAKKYPYHVSLKDREYFFMAGVWQPWIDKVTGEYVESFAIVTTKANELMEYVHNSKKRMPLILDDKLAFEWIFGDLSEDRICEIAGTQYPSEKMQACEVEKDFKDSFIAGSAE